MADTKIEWTEKTWNLIVGCSIVSPGCHHCYAATLAKRLRAMALADIRAGRSPGRKRHYIDVVDDEGRWTGKLAPVPEAIADPLGWKKPTEIFVNSMSDLFHESVSDEFITAVFGVMLACPQHTFQVLTKRVDRMRGWAAWIAAAGGLGRYIRSDEGRNRLRGWFDAVAQTEVVGKRRYRTNDDPWAQVMNGAACHMGMQPPSNVLIGASIEDQKRLKERMPQAAHIGALGWRVMLSCEPLLGALEFDPLLLRQIAWVIVGGESGPGSRVCDVGWIRTIVGSCKSEGVPCFVKQLGARPTTDHRTRPRGEEAYWTTLLKDKKGGDPAEWPADLRVRELPSVEVAP